MNAQEETEHEAKLDAAYSDAYKHMKKEVSKLIISLGYAGATGEEIGDMLMDLMSEAREGAIREFNARGGK